MKLKKGEYVVTAWAESPSGPGWSNSLVWVIVASPGGGVLRREAMQPGDLTGDMWTLFEVNKAAARAMTAAVERALGAKRQ